MIWIDGRKIDIVPLSQGRSLVNLDFRPIIANYFTIVYFSSTDENSSKGGHSRINRNTRQQGFGLEWIRVLKELGEWMIHHHPRGAPAYH